MEFEERFARALSPSTPGAELARLASGEEWNPRVRTHAAINPSLPRARVVETMRALQEDLRVASPWLARRMPPDNLATWALEGPEHAKHAAAAVLDGKTPYEPAPRAALANALVRRAAELDRPIPEEIAPALESFVATLSAHERMEHRMCAEEGKAAREAAWGGGEAPPRERPEPLRLVVADPGPAIKPSLLEARQLCLDLGLDFDVPGKGIAR